MLLILSIIVIYNRALIIDSAPKLGHINFDPLSNEAKLSEMTLKDIILNLMNNHYNNSAPEQDKVLNTTSKFKSRRADGVNSNRTHCTGYDYDETICKTVDDRVICGYNKNIGEIQNESVEVGNGCRIRGDRLECGYLKGPFNNTRRPPVSEEEEESDSEDDKKKLHHTVNLKSSTRKKNSNTLTTPPTTVSNLTSTTKNKSYESTSHVTKADFISSSSTNKPKVIKEKTVAKRKKRCVEKNDSIFCYENKS